MVCSAFEKYGDVPMWQAVEIMTLGTLSKLYTNTLDTEIRQGVAKFFGVRYRKMRSWMPAITEVRNRCAHFNRLTGRNLIRQPSRIDGVHLDNKNSFYVVLVLLKLLSSDMVFGDFYTTNQGIQMVSDLVRLFDGKEDLCTICGIPENWRELIGSHAVLGVDGQILAKPPSADAR